MIYDGREPLVCSLEANEAVFADELWPKPEFLGADADGAYTTLRPGVRLYDCRLKVIDVRCGIRFPLTTSELVFCPSGIETEPLRIPFEEFRTQQLTLALTNGLIQLGDGLFLVKDIRSVHLCAIVDRLRKTVEFAVQGANAGRHYRWHFYVLHTTLDNAVRYANRINRVAPIAGHSIT
jgi:hypothetical protein